MKYLIVAGGHGTRLWPLSRKNSPKQFEKLIYDQSTLQLMYSYVRHSAPPEDIYISTNVGYVEIVKDQLPELPAENIIGEPERRDLLAAIGFALMSLRLKHISGNISIVWSDHLVRKVDEFTNTFALGESILQKYHKKMVYVGEVPTYPAHNLGWIGTGPELDAHVFEFNKWHYRPPLETAQEYFNSGTHLWNTGYFITSIEYLLSAYQQWQPQTFKILEEMYDAVPAKVAQLYAQIPKLSFDNGIVEHLPAGDAAVIKTQMEWTDPGTLYAFKDSLVGSGAENLTIGQTVVEDTTDSLIYNSEGKEKLVAVIGLKGMIVVNTPDALLVIHKDDVPKVGKLVEKLGKEGFDKWQ